MSWVVSFVKNNWIACLLTLRGLLPHFKNEKQLSVFFAYVWSQWMWKGTRQSEALSPATGFGECLAHSVMLSKGRLAHLTLVSVLRGQVQFKVCWDACFPFLQVDIEGTETEFVFKMEFVIGLALLIAVFTTCLVSIDYQFCFQALRIQLWISQK